MRPEFELLLHCARPQPVPRIQARIFELLDSPLNWDLFYTASAWHGLLPLTYWNLSRICDEREFEQQAEEIGEGSQGANWSTAVPPHVLREFEREFQENAARNFYLTGQLLPVLDALEEHGVRAVTYKGPALAQLAYGNPLLRTFCDLDLLVARRDLAEVQRQMESLGYQQQFHSNLPANEYAHSFVRDADDGCTVIEVHWALTPRNYALPSCPPGAMERLITVAINHREVLAMAREDQVLALCWHAYKHRWSRLEWIACLAELVSQAEGSQLDWDLLSGLARQTGSRRMLFCGLGLAEALFEVTLPPAISTALQRDRTLKSLLPVLRESLVSRAPGETSAPRSRAIRFFHLGSRERLRDKFSYCWRTALATGQADWAGLRPGRLFSAPKAEP